MDLSLLVWPILYVHYDILGCKELSAVRTERATGYQQSSVTEERKNNQCVRRVILKPPTNLNLPHVCNPKLQLTNRTPKRNHLSPQSSQKSQIRLHNLYGHVRSLTKQLAKSFGIGIKIREQVSSPRLYDT